MKTFTSVVALFGLLTTTLASAHALEKRWDNGTTVVTDVVTAYTTFCPAATTFAFNNVTYTVSSSTTLTITNCPCTITHTTPIASISSLPAGGGGGGAPAGTGSGGSGGSAPHVTTSTTVVGPVASTKPGNGGSATSSHPALATGAAAAAFAPEFGLYALGAVVVVLL